MTEKFEFFWRNKSPFSQWHPSTFVLAGVTYTCAEQYMMAGKARLFGDAEAEQKILAARSPNQQKQFGRQVRPFDPTVWEANARKIVYDGNEGKFTQNPALLAALLATRGRTLVEASPMDRIWGIGLAAENPLAQSRATWRGKNWLGEVLTALREDLIARGVAG